MPMPVEVNRSSEALPVIELSPEKVGEALNLEADEVRAQLKSVDGRKQLLADLTRNPETLQSVIDPDSLKTFEQDMEMTERDLRAEQKFLEAQKDPEKKGMFRRAWDTVTGFPRKHPVITVALLGVVLGVVASYMGWLPALNFGGLWGRAQGWFGWGAASGEAAGEAAAETAAGAGSAAYEAGESVLPTGIEAPLGTLESLKPAARIGIDGTNFIFNNEIYTMDQLPDLLKKLPAISEDMPLKIGRYPTSLPSAEIGLQELLQGAGISENDIHWIPGMIQKDFIPLDQIPSGQ